MIETGTLVKRNVLETKRECALYAINRKTVVITGAPVALGNWRQKSFKTWRGCGFCSSKPGAHPRTLSGIGAWQ
jgi:hypothetical protein